MTFAPYFIRMDKINKILFLGKMVHQVKNKDDFSNQLKLAGNRLVVVGQFISIHSVFILFIMPSYFNHM